MLRQSYCPSLKGATCQRQGGRIRRVFCEEKPHQLHAVVVKDVAANEVRNERRRLARRKQREQCTEDLGTRGVIPAAGARVAGRVYARDRQPARDVADAACERDGKPGEPVGVPLEVWSFTADLVPG